MGLKSLVKSVVVNKYNTAYEKELAARKCSYHAWIAGEEAGYASVGETEAVEYLLAYNSEGHAAKPAEEWIAEAFARNPEAVLLYGDEDVWPQGGERTAPLFKPDWSPDLFEERFYFGGLVAVRKSWLSEHAPQLLKKWELTDCGLSPREDCQAVVTETVVLLGAYKKGAGRRRIHHIPRILFHSDSEEGRELWMEYEDGFKVNLPGTEGKLVSVIIPSKDNPELLDQCIGSVIKCGAGVGYEIVVVDNGSAPDKRRQIEAVLHHYRQTAAKELKRILYHYDKMDFNFSRMCNLGAKKASGDLLLFLNDDVAFVQEGTLARLAALALRPGTGAVGLKLLYPAAEGEPVQIQHAGITNLPMGPVHKLQFCGEETCYLGRNKGRHNYLAVTAACLMVEKTKFNEIGGFAEELAVAFNDVDLCFSLYKAGYENVCECDYFAYHNESYSRGDDESSEKLQRLLSERAKLYRRHPELEAKDPYYPKYLNRDGLDTRIRPIYEQGKRAMQLVDAGSISGFVLWDENQWTEQLSRCREDACLMVRVESVMCKEEALRMTGWSVVLGDNNACYEKTLLLKGAEGGCFGLVLAGQYRPDLMENMPDQTNVGLCGYQVEWEDGILPAGQYQVGMMARNLVNGTGLINWSNRMVEV